MSFLNRCIEFLRSAQFANSPILLFLILGFAVITRFYRLELPSTYYFDEVYHAITVKFVAQNNPWAFEWWHPEIERGVMIDWLHPPLAKYIQALGVLVFGFTSFGWRVASAVMGVGVVWLTYLLGKELFSKKIGLLAAFLVSLDGLLLVQSRLAMNDVHVTFFILATLLMYRIFLKKKTWVWFLVVCGMAGLSIASKWSGAFVIGALGLWEIGLFLNKYVVRQKDRKTIFTIDATLVQKGAELIFKGILLIAIPACIYIASYGQAFLQGKDWAHFKELHNQIWRYQTTLTATHSYQSRPWQWFLNVRPIWYHVSYEVGKTPANIYAFGNPALHLFGVAAVGISLLWIATSKDKNKESVIWLVCVYFCLWLPWQFSPRIMFYYHYLPAVPLLTIMLSYWLSQKSNKRILFVVGVILVCFLIWYPRWTGISAPVLFETLYTIVKAWK